MFMKIKYKYSIGERVIYHNEPVTIKSRIGRGKRPSYRIEEYENLIIEEQELFPKKQIEYIITPEMQNLIDSFEALGYEVQIATGESICYDMRENIRFLRYATEISIDKFDGDDEPYSFLFAPNGRRISDDEYSPEYCECDEW